MQFSWASPESPSMPCHSSLLSSWIQDLLPTSKEPATIYALIPLQGSQANPYMVVVNGWVENRDCRRAGVHLSSSYLGVLQALLQTHHFHCIYLPLSLGILSSWVPPGCPEHLRLPSPNSSSPSQSHCFTFLHQNDSGFLTGSSFQSQSL